MLRIILALLATLVVCASPLTARASSVVDAERAATVYITINDSGHGTGFAIASRGGLTTILTAKHVVVGAASLTVTDALGDTHEVVGAPTLDPAHDVASIQVRGQMPTVRVATFESSPADPVVQHVQVIGNPGNEVSLLSPAFVLYHYGADDPVMPGDYAIQCETCSYGDSGAPVFDAAGDALGVVYGVKLVNGKASSHFFVVPLSTITAGVAPLVVTAQR